MDKIESLIKALADLKEELNKNVNCSYGDAPNTAKADTFRPDKGFGSVTVKDMNQKPANPAKPFGSVILKEEIEKDSKDPALAPKEVKIKELQSKIDAGKYKPDASKIAGAMLKEELMCSENGQWNLMEKSAKSVHIDPSGHHEDDDGNTSTYHGHIHVDGEKVHVSGTDRDSSTTHQKHIVNHVAKKLGIHPEHVNNAYHVIHHELTAKKPKPFSVHKVHNGDGEGEAISVKPHGSHLSVVKAEELTCSENGQWNIEKAVRQPNMGSPAVYENKPTKEGAAKPKKYQGGDPRHADKGPTRAGNEREFLAPHGPTKYGAHTSGVSSLREGTKHHESVRDTSWDKAGKPVKWNR